MSKIQTKTSSSQGRIKFDDTPSSIGTYIYSCRAYNASSPIYDEVEVVVGELNSLNAEANGFFNVQDKIGVIGQSIRLITYIEADTDDLSDYAISFVNKGVSNIRYTNDAGVASFDYRCTGTGDVNINVKCGAWSQLINFTDAIQYWRNNGSMNKSYSVFYGTFRELSNYFAFETSSTNQAAVVYLAKNLQSECITDDWFVSFDVVSCSSSFSMYYGYRELADIESSGKFSIVPVTLKPKDKVTIYKEDGLIYLVVNGLQLSSFAHSGFANVPLFGILGTNGASYLNFNNLVYKRL